MLAFKEVMGFVVPGPTRDRARNKLIKIFKDMGLSSTIELGLASCVDFLDTILDL